MWYFLVAITLAVLSVSNATGNVGALLFQGPGTTEQIAGVLTSLQSAYVGHVALCQSRMLSDPKLSAETVKYVHDWGQKTGIKVATYKTFRNACLAQYRQSGLVPMEGYILLVEWNMRLQVQSKKVWRLPVDALYGMAPDQNGGLFDWTPLLLRIKAHCGYFGRFLCVDNSYAYGHLQRTHYEMDSDRAERELIEGAYATMDIGHMASLMTNVSITRHPSWTPGQEEGPILKLQDRQFAFAWEWLGRAYETRGQWKEAHTAYLQRTELDNPVVWEDGKWYATYRTGVVVLSDGGSVHEASGYLLDAYNMQPSRREPLAVLTRAYRVAGKFALCRLYGMAALSIPFPTTPWTGPHVEVHVYEWTLVDDTSLCLMDLHDYAGAVALLEHVLQRPSYSTASAEDVDRLRQNLAWSKEQMASK
jgi:hypothetical protein